MAEERRPKYPYTPQVIYPRDELGREKYLIDELNKISQALNSINTDGTDGGDIMVPPGSDDCWCIQLCEGDDPYVPGVYECDAYENALLASPLTDVWFMNDNPGQGVDPVNNKGGPITLDSIGAKTDGPALVPDTCTPENSYEVTAAAYLNAIGEPTSLAWTFLWNTTSGNNNRVWLYRHGPSTFGFQIMWGGAGVGVGNDSDLIVRATGREDGSEPVFSEDLIFTNVMPSEGTSILVTAQNQGAVTVYVNYVPLPTQYWTKDIYGVGGSLNPAMQMGGATNTVGTMSHVGFAPFIISDPDIAALKDGWDRNHADYADPTPPNPGDVVFEVGDILEVSEVDPDTGIATWCPTSGPFKGYGSVSQTIAPFAATLGAGYTVLLSDQSDLNTPVAVTQDAVNNGLIFEQAGVWSITTSFTIGHDVANDGRTFDVELYNSTDAVSSNGTTVGVGRNVEYTNFSASLLVDVPESAVGDLFQIRIGGTADTFITVTQVSYTFNANKIGGI